MNKHEAAFVIAEIRNVERYDSMLRTKRSEIKRIEERIIDMATPKSANGGITIKPMTFYPDGSIKDMGEQFSVRGTTTNKDSLLIELITDKEEALKAYNEIRYRQTKIQEYIKEIKDKTNNDEFISDFIGGRSYMELADDYGYSNPYRHAINVLTKIEMKIF